MSDQQVSNTTYVLKRGARSLIKTLLANTRGQRREKKKNEIHAKQFMQRCKINDTRYTLNESEYREEINAHFRYQRNGSVQSVHRLNRAIKNN